MDTGIHTHSHTVIDSNDDCIISHGDGLIFFVVLFFSLVFSFATMAHHIGNSATKLKQNTQQISRLRSPVRKPYHRSCGNNNNCVTTPGEIETIRTRNEGGIFICNISERKKHDKSEIKRTRANSLLWLCSDWHINKNNNKRKIFLISSACRCASLSRSNLHAQRGRQCAQRANKMTNTFITAHSWRRYKVRKREKKLCFFRCTIDIYY